MHAVGEPALDYLLCRVIYGPAKFALSSLKDFIDIIIIILAK
jgi:hypothetical protein